MPSHSSTFNEVFGLASKEEKRHNYLLVRWDVELDHGEVVCILYITSLVDTMGNIFYFVEICWHIHVNGLL